MLNLLKKFFTENLGVEPEAPQPTEFGVSVDGIAHIRQMKNGKFRLLVNQNEVIGTYSRQRDAIRGANRRGLNVVSVS